MAGQAAIPVLVGPFPGPVHGVSVINAKLAERMEAAGLAIRRIDLAPRTARRGMAYHLSRAARVLRGFGHILVAPLSGRHRYVMSVDGGLGLFYNLLLALAAQLTGQGMLLYHHSTRYVLEESRIMRLLVSIVGRATPQVFCSARMAALFEARYGAAGPTVIVGNAAWVDSITPGPGSGSGLRLGFLSSLTLAKGLDRAIATLRRVRDHGLEAELVLAGPVLEASAQNVIDRALAEFGPALSLRGMVMGEDKAKFYGSLDFFLFPSLYPHETQSLVVPEALAAGTPVIAYDHRFVGEIMGAAGRLIPESEDFADPAAEFIAAKRSEFLRAEQRMTARKQYDMVHAAAQGQVDQLIAWASGG